MLKNIILVPVVTLFVVAIHEYSIGFVSIDAILSITIPKRGVYARARVCVD